MHTVELRIRIQNPNRYRNQDQNTQSGGLSFCQLVAIYSNRLSEEKASRWMLVSDACNDAAHEVIGKPKLVQPYYTIPWHTIPYYKRPGQKGCQLSGANQSTASATAAARKCVKSRGPTKPE